MTLSTALRIGLAVVFILVLSAWAFQAKLWAMGVMLLVLAPIGITRGLLTRAKREALRAADTKAATERVRQAEAIDDGARRFLGRIGGSLMRGCGAFAVICLIGYLVHHLTFSRIDSLIAVLAVIAFPVCVAIYPIIRLVNLYRADRAS